MLISTLSNGSSTVDSVTVLPSLGRSVPFQFQEFCSLYESLEVVLAYMGLPQVNNLQGSLEFSTYDPRDKEYEGCWTLKFDQP